MFFTAFHGRDDCDAGRPVARIDFKVVQDLQKVDLLDPKSELFEPQPP